MKALLLIFASALLLSACAKNSAEITVISPISAIVTAPRNLAASGATIRPEVIKVAQDHCQKVDKNAVLEKSWVVAFDADYFQFECK